jgi:ribosome-binding protein aMBF1 (putative translation factor)
LIFSIRGPWSVESNDVTAHDGGMPISTRQSKDPSLVALGEAIRRRREAKELSQEQLALLADVDRSYVGRVERGTNNAATLTLKRLANALGMTLTELIAEAGL